MVVDLRPDFAWWRIAYLDRISTIATDTTSLLTDNLANWDTCFTLALAEVVVTLAVDGRTGVWTAAVTLTDKALAHARVLVCFVSTFCKPDSCQLIHLFKILCKTLQRPESTRLQQILHEICNFLWSIRRVVDPWVLKEVFGRHIECRLCVRCHEARILIINLFQLLRWNKIFLRTNMMTSGPRISLTFCLGYCRKLKMLIRVPYFQRANVGWLFGRGFAYLGGKWKIDTAFRSKRRLWRYQAFPELLRK